jgi:HEAT repeat protein
MTAAELLGRYGAEAQDALPDLVAIARNGQVWPHFLAVHIAAIGQAAVPTMADALADRDRNVRQLAAHALERLGAAARPAEPAIMNAFWEADEEDLQFLKRTIAAVGLSRQSVSEFLDKVKSPDAEAKSRAWAAIGALADSDARVQEGLFELLASDDSATTLSAFRVMMHVRFERHPQVARQVIERIGRLIVTNPRIPADPDAGFGEMTMAPYAANALIALGPDAEPALASLLEALKSEDVKVQLSAAQVIASIGPRARSALPQLAVILKQHRTPESRVDFYRGEAAFRKRDMPAGTIAFALAQVGGADSAAAVAQALDDPDLQTRQFVYAHLVDLGRESNPALDSLIAALSSQRADIRNSAVHLLAMIGPDAAAAVPKLTERLQDDRVYIRKAAALALGRIGRAARTAEPALQRLKEERLATLRAAAEQALRDIQ